MNLGVIVTRRMGTIPMRNLRFVIRHAVVPLETTERLAFGVSLSFLLLKWFSPLPVSTFFVGALLKLVEGIFFC